MVSFDVAADDEEDKDGLLGGSPIAMTLGWSLYLSSDCLEDDAVDSSGE